MASRCITFSGKTNSKMELHRPEGHITALRNKRKEMSRKQRRTEASSEGRGDVSGPRRGRNAIGGIEDYICLLRCHIKNGNVLRNFL